MRLIDNVFLIRFAILPVVYNESSGNRPHACIQSLSCFSLSCLTQHSYVMRYVLSGHFRKKTEHLHVHRISKIKDHPVCGDEKTVCFFTDISEYVVLHSCLISEESGNLIDKHSLD